MSVHHLRWREIFELWRLPGRWARSEPSAVLTEQREHERVPGAVQPAAQEALVDGAELPDGVLKALVFGIDEDRHADGAAEDRLPDQPVQAADHQAAVVDDGQRQVPVEPVFGLEHECADDGAVIVAGNDEQPAVDIVEILSAQIEAYLLAQENEDVL